MWDLMFFFRHFIAVSVDWSLSNDLDTPRPAVNTRLQTLCGNSLDVVKHILNSSMTLKDVVLQMPEKYVGRRGGGGEGRPPPPQPASAHRPPRPS